VTNLQNKNVDTDVVRGMPLDKGYLGDNGLQNFPRFEIVLWAILTGELSKPFDLDIITSFSQGHITV